MHYSLKLIMPTAQVQGTRENIEPIMKRLRCWDWYVIGGRWSGSLNQRFPWFAEFEKAEERIKQECGIEHWYMPEWNDRELPVRRNQMPALEQVQAAWSKYSNLPVNLARDSYRAEGYRDDIAVYDDLMKRWLIERYPTATHCYYDEFKCYYLYISDKKHLAKLPTDGSYTVVLVDYHD